MSETGYSRFPACGNYDFLQLELSGLARKTLAITDRENLVEPTERTPSTWLSHGHHPSFMPMHTDYPDFETPPHYVLLECLNVGAEPVQTVFCDVAKKAFVHKDRDYLLNDPWLIVAGARRGKITRILESDRDTGDLRIRYAKNVMRPFYKESKSFNALVGLIDEIGSRSIFLNIGEAVVFDNWRLMHGRICAPSNSGWKPGPGRVLQRLMFT
jgi:hypothetical protein